MIRRSSRLHPLSARSARQARWASVPAPPPKRPRAPWPASAEAARRAAVALQRESRAERFRKSLLAATPAGSPEIGRLLVGIGYGIFDADLPSLMTFTSQPIHGLNEMFPVSPITNRGTPIDPARRAAWATVSPMPSKVAKPNLAGNHITVPHLLQRAPSESMSLQHQYGCSLRSSARTFVKF
ncbi:hypothetical protein B0H14DRAFT_2715350 [Mycena olivaceomarginata]|nr:hypothetical protein B0H14DRAFT_2715350 [Mycena olivaceomarginata]